eukprot:m.13443 g.13443  ORF g.13443 m.13443 type:complete len:348 (-) comp9735_c0_seq1:20-1063(-)
MFSPSSTRLALLCVGVVFAITQLGVAVDDVTPPSTFIWAQPRGGSWVLLNSLASSGYWKKNSTAGEPNLFQSLGPICADAHPNGIPSDATYTELVEKLESNGDPFLIKEHVFSLLQGGGSVRLHKFLKNPAYKHIFLIRDPFQSCRSTFTTLTAAQFHPSVLEGGQDNPMASFLNKVYIDQNVDPLGADHIAGCACGSRFQYMLYYHLVNTLGLVDNTLVVDIADVWDSPEASMRQIASFLDVPFTNNFLKWDDINFQFYAKDTPCDPWVAALRSSGGWMKRPRGGSVLASAPTNNIDLLTPELLKVVADNVLQQKPYYKFFKIDVPKKNCLNATAADDAQDGHSEL